MIDTISPEHIIADRYRLVEEVGQGGMATVFRGQDLLLEREIAVKILHPHLARDSEHRQRFRREARTIARLHHTNIVEIYDFSEQDSQSDRSTTPTTYLIMEYIDGQNLQSFLEKQEFPLCELAAGMVAIISEALEHAHQQHIIHRDLKPENVLLCKQGDIKLTDFGLSKILDHEGMTRTGSILGSPAYMAPEQIQGRLGDHRADIFALGIILYRLACHKHPFMRANPAATLQAISHVDYVDPEKAHPGMGRQLAGIIRCALSPEPEQRYSSTAAMLQDLLLYLHEVGIHHPKETLAAFFRNPNDEGQRLRRQILLQLKQRAYTLAANKKLAMALDRCNRAIALEPHDPDIDKLVERLSQADRWFQNPTFWMRFGLAASLLFTVVWYAPSLWHTWTTKATTRGSSHPQQPFRDVARTRPSQANIHPLMNTSPQLRNKVHDVAPQNRKHEEPRPRGHLSTSQTPVSPAIPERRLGKEQKIHRVAKSHSSVTLSPQWRPVHLGQYHFALRYQPQGNWLHVRGLRRVQIRVNRQKVFSSAKSQYRIALRGVSPYRMMVVDRKQSRTLWLIPPASRPPVIREEPTTPRPQSHPPHLLNVDAEKDAITRNIILHIEPFASVQVTSGSLKKSGLAQRTHFLSLRSNRIWTIQASHPYAHARMWRIRVPNSNVPEAQEVDLQGKSLRDWKPLVTSPDSAGFALRGEKMIFKSVFFYLSCNVPDATLILNGQIRGPLSTRKQTFNVPWIWKSVSTQISIEVSHDLYQDWQRTVTVKPGQHVSIDIQIKPRSSLSPPRPAPIVPPKSR